MTTTPGRALVTGASGYVGGQLVPALIERGWRVRVLSRSASHLAGRAWSDDVEVAEGSVDSADDLAAALADVDVAYFLVHSMDGAADFRRRDRDNARTFAAAAEQAQVGRIVYLGGLHPDTGLSEHLASRVEVGEIFIEGTVPAVVLQAGVVLGDGSASFDMLRHLTERLPVVVAPRWLRNAIQPVAVDDVVFYLAEAAALPPDTNRAYDVGGPDVLTYADMMKRYAAVTGLGPRLIATVPVLTPELASRWVGLVTPVPSGIARPLVGSLINDAVCDENDILRDVGEPEGGRLGFAEAVRRATADLDPSAFRSAMTLTGSIVGAAAAAGSFLSNPRSAWYRSLRLPSWQPPALAFPVVWTALYADAAVTTGASVAELREGDRDEEATALVRAVVVNMGVNALWSAVFFRMHRPGAATVVAGLLTMSGADLVRRVATVRPGRAAALAAYPAWCAFATVLSAAVAARNRSR
ncbi:conserved hypothetical protein [Nostocoides japonicum T1-X7]|uniref:NAD(P)-binding domain-containing protein n=1 Tax=Nostocoides japonicum T1-X7 TaxID=1194083 RepID=A0A077LU27_9MICO|nr:tryptophan-rich sensory protein [Tetrasphaera japonica]CCH77193.1 conserved hypothetical protein [Tetrasphaera japonica T1-X7]